MRKKHLFQYKICCISAVFFVCILILFMTVNGIKKDREFSEQENRMLTQKPELSLNGIINRKFMEQWERYKTDQFVGRDLWVEIKTGTNFVLGKRKEAGVFYGKDGYLLEDTADSEGENTRKNLESIIDFTNQYPELRYYFMLVPNAANIWNEKLPYTAAFTIHDQKTQMESVRHSLENHVQWIDVQKTLQKHSEEDIYYQTDHHWTTLGAYYAFQEAADIMEFDLDKSSDLKAYEITDQFNGTLSSISGYKRKKKESITAYLPQSESYVYTLIEDNEGRKSVSLYDTKKLEGKDKYAVFLGGNAPVLTIKTTADSDRRIMILKDSYANCYIPFLVPYYNRIIIVDPRYYYGDIRKLISENQIQEILFLYNANTFFQDNSLYGVIES